jgi:hypothetical protein
MPIMSMYWGGGARGSRVGKALGYRRKVAGSRPDGVKF